MASLYQKHRERWINCQQCQLCTRRNKVVLARGTVPAQILFVGEAPGASEDVLGMPFVGPAGKLLDHIIEKALNCEYTYAITNLIACIPKDEHNTKVEAPSKEDIAACAERLQEFVGLCQPSLIVNVGQLATKYAQASLNHPPRAYRWINIVHPAAILRADISQQGLAVQTAIVTLADAAGEL